MQCKPLYPTVGLHSAVRRVLLLNPVFGALLMLVNITYLLPRVLLLLGINWIALVLAHHPSLAWNSKDIQTWL